MGRAAWVFGGLRWFAVALLVTGSPALAEGYDADEAYRVSQAAIGRALPDLRFVDSVGAPVDLRSFRGKPLVINMVYTSCHHICPTLTRTLAYNVDIAREALGESSFNVISVGFDAAVDTPDRMRTYARQQGIADTEWKFLSGSDTTVRKLADDLGFLYWPSAKGFDHLLQTTIADASGRVYRQVYGSTYDSPRLVEPLKELVFDTPRDAGFVRHWVDRFRLFCTVFDPNSGRYDFDYSIAVTLFSGILCLGAVGFFIVHEWRRR